MSKVHSAQQLDIIHEFNVGTHHIVIRARAGTGKTTIIIDGVEVAPEKAILMCCFNSRIKDELKVRVKNPRVTVSTLHSVGFQAVLRFWERLALCKGFERSDKLTSASTRPTDPDAIKRLVTKLHQKGRDIAPHAKVLGDLTDIAWEHECTPDEQWQRQGYDVTYVEQCALRAMELAATVKPVDTGIDYCDMTFLPVRNHWLTKMYDLVVVDEAQDMNAAQLEIAQGVCSGRIVVVGDDRQAIYKFRGADSDSIDRLKRELQAKELPLTMTYRCAKSIVQLAAEIVPDFSCPDTAPEGSVTEIPYEQLVKQAGPGNFVLSRMNAPLVSVAMSLLRAGKRTVIAGKDIGKGLVNLLTKMKARSVPDLIGKISTWEEREVERVKKMKGDIQPKIEAIRDQAAMLLSLTDGATNVAEVVERIEWLFTDTGLGQQGVITCSSVHKSKGLEADKVFILANTLMYGDIEEENIRYVAITRARSELVWVND